LLDEPTDGLDPEGIHEFRSTILKLRAERGLTILFNSHLLGEVGQMCDSCVILREGKKVYEGSVRDDSKQTPRYALKSPDMQRARELVTQMGACLLDDGTIETTQSLDGPTLLARITAAGVRVESWSPVRQTLEDWYMELSNPQSAIHNPKS
jgi:ABC-2 type transport system ATP-binding protein